ncbi:MAG: hypothetical protein EKK34_12635 [Mycobacterium sp.]|nr:MAG: hypothetical protein EKK34_12635 [Mycobacterium sp.]
MTDRDERFFSMDLDAPWDHQVEGYTFVPPGIGWAWDTTPEHPPHKAKPCPECDEASEPRRRFEFEPEERMPGGSAWAVGVGVFTWVCPEHGEFVGEVIERLPKAPRNGRVVIR